MWARMVFEHVQVKAAQVFGAKQLQLGHHGVKFVHLEVAQHLGFLQVRGHQQLIEPM